MNRISCEARSPHRLNSVATRHKMEELLAAERQKVMQVTLEAIAAIAKTEEAKDSYTNAHSERVADTSVKIAKKLGWSGEKVEKLRYQALLHDIGKIGIPDRILNKHKNLTEKEYGIMKQHVKIGADILKNLSTMEGLEEGALYHHERWDGKGYLSGKKREEIPEAARIIAVADTYDAMSFERIYRGSFDESHVTEEIRCGRGTQFDPKVADAVTFYSGGAIGAAKKLTVTDKCLLRQERKRKFAKSH